MQGRAHELPANATNTFIPTLPGMAAPAHLEIRPYEVRSLSPPKDSLRIEHGQVLPTPTDDRGLVQEDELIELVKNTVVAGYEWRGQPDVHHLYWEEDWYRDHNLFRLQHGRLMKRFVDLPVHRVFMPREFHNHLHQVTQPVEVPDSEVMHYRVEGWNVAVRLFNEARGIEDTLHYTESRHEDVKRNPFRIERNMHKYGYDHATVEWYVEMMRKHFTGLVHRVGELERVPDEFRFVEPAYLEAIFDETKPSDVDPSQVNRLRKQVQRIGNIAAHKAVDVRHLVNSKPAEEAA